jgi:hypothetical protein
MERLLDRIDESNWLQERLPLEFEGGVLPRYQNRRNP